MTIKIEGYSAGDSSVGIGQIDFSIDTGLNELDDDEKKWINKTIMRDLWELHDNGKLIWFFSDDKSTEDGIDDIELLRTVNIMTYDLSEGD